MFDWRTPTTYIFAFTYQLLVTACIVIVGSVLLLQGFGSIWILIAFIGDIKSDMSALDAYKRNETSDAVLYKHLCEFIKFHTEIKQLAYCMP